MSFRLSFLFASLFSLLLLSACPTAGRGDDDDAAGDDDDATGDADATISSGVYTVRSTFFTENDCGQDEDMFFPEALTLDVSGSNVTIEEFDVSGTLSNGEFEVGREYVQSYLADGFECVLDIEVTLEGTVVADDVIDVVFEVYIDEAPLEPDADCPWLAELDYGFTAWNDITGCRAEGTWTMER